MDSLIEYLIPVSGLKIGLHTFDFQIDSEFFTHFPDSLIQEGAFAVNLEFEKKRDLYELVFSYKGDMKTPCDRCLAAISFPIEGNNKLIVKFADEFLEDTDVIYIPADTEKLNIAKYIYEYICLGVPFVKVFDCDTVDPQPCDQEMLALLEKEAGEDTETPPSNPLWDQLKNIKFN